MTRWPWLVAAATGRPWLVEVTGRGGDRGGRVRVAARRRRRRVAAAGCVPAAGGRRFSLFFLFLVFLFSCRWYYNLIARDNQLSCAVGPPARENTDFRMRAKRPYGKMDMPAWKNEFCSSAGTLLSLLFGDAKETK